MINAPSARYSNCNGSFELSRAGAKALSLKRHSFGSLSTSGSNGLISRLPCSAAGAAVGLSEVVTMTGSEVGALRP